MDAWPPIARWLIGIGIALVLAGLLWPILGRLGLGRLPGDIAIERDGFRLYVPLVSCIVISAVLSLLFWLFRR
jgi:Protein of unknown function (DUF2905)